MSNDMFKKNEKITTITYFVTMRNFIFITTTSFAIIIDMNYYVPLHTIRINYDTIQVIPFKTRDALLTVTNKGIISLLIGKKTFFYNDKERKHENSFLNNMIQQKNDLLLESSIQFIQSQTQTQSKSNTQFKSNSCIDNEANYKLCLGAVSDSLKLDSNEKCFGIAVNPVNELEIAVFINEGQIAFQTLKSKIKNKNKSERFLNI